MILMIDHYDSFTFNLVQYIGEAGKEVVVREMDKITLEEIHHLKPEAIVLSPGPCSPNEAGISLDIVKTFSGIYPILGVCLGHQTIIQAFGGEITRVEELYHGKTSQIIHDGKSMYHRIPNPFTVARYHSLGAEVANVPECLEITAKTSKGEVMGVRHVDYAVEGVQFHPESILTEHGKTLLNNFFEHYLLKTTVDV